ncbi:MAG: DUF2207 domain-containing protein [Sphingomonadales bacterium]
MGFFRGILLGFFILVSSAAFAEEAILSYDARIIVRPSGELDITETILVRAEGNLIRRGIYRDFPTVYTLPNGVNVSTTFDVHSVLMDGGAVNWTTEGLRNGTRVRIGDANIFLKTGTYTYTISYTTGRQLYFGEGQDELYWNVTGNGWAFPIHAASASVQLPEGTYIQDIRAFTGRQGEAGTAFRYDRTGERQAYFETTRRLAPREGLTIVVTWPEGVVIRPTTADKAANFFSDNLSLIVAYIGFLLIIGYFYMAWLEVGRDPKAGPIYARYGPPAGVSPGAMSFVLARAYRKKAFTAAIVSMATKGYLTISEKSKKKYILKKTGKSVRLAEGEQAVADSLFGPWGDEIETHHTNHKEFAAAIKAQKEVLEKNHEGINFIRNQKHFWIGAGISLGVVVLTIFTSVSGGGLDIVFSVGFIAFYGLIIFALRKKAYVFKAAGSVGRKVAVLFTFIFITTHFMGMAGALVFNNFFIVVPFILILVINILFYNLLEKPTLEGRRLLDGIEGFKKYLSVAEKDRLEFHTGEITPEVFEKFLPFAIALGVETKWGKAFEASMARAGMDPGTYSPVWYHGHGYHTFSSSNGFAAGFGSSFSSSISSASSPPSTAGSGGGGFSGGGGGGGGGGGW